MRKPLKYRWVDAFLSEEGPRAIVRLVLLILADHMGNDGGQCYPGVRLIQRKANLTRPTVIHALSEARDEWTTVEPHTGGRKGGIYHQYHPRFPDWWQSESGKAANPLTGDESGKAGEPVTADGSGKADDESGKADTAEAVKLLNLTYPRTAHLPPMGISHRAQARESCPGLEVEVEGEKRHVGQRANFLRVFIHSRQARSTTNASVSHFGAGRLDS